MVACCCCRGSWQQDAKAESLKSDSWLSRKTELTWVKVIVVSIDAGERQESVGERLWFLLFHLGNGSLFLGKDV